MKLIVIGARGTIGGFVTQELSSQHEIVRAGRNGPDVEVDITSPDSIKRMYDEVGTVDGVICTAGGAAFAPVTELTPERNEEAIESKLKGQLNLVLIGHEYVNDDGSFTLTTGVMMDDPIRYGASAAMANGGVKYFVQSAAIEMPRGQRINSVSPALLKESVEKYGELFPGFAPVSGRRIALAYRKSVEGGQTGQSYEIYSE